MEGFYWGAPVGFVPSTGCSELAPPPPAIMRKRPLSHDPRQESYDDDAQSQRRKRIGDQPARGSSVCAAVVDAQLDRAATAVMRHFRESLPLSVVAALVAGPQLGCRGDARISEACARDDDDAAAIPLSFWPYIAEHLGWPRRGDQSAFVLLFALTGGKWPAELHPETDNDERGRCEVTYADVRAVLQKFNCLDIRGITAAQSTELTAAYEANTAGGVPWIRGGYRSVSPTPLYREYHAFVFNYLVCCETNFGAGSATRCRSIPIAVASQAILSTLGQRTMFAAPLSMFLCEQGAAARSFGHAGVTRLRRSINRDEWNMILSFCVSMDFPQCCRYDVESWWPTLLDDFVAWHRQRLLETSP